MVRTVHTTIEIKRLSVGTTANGQPFYLLQHGFKDIAIFAIIFHFGIPKLGSIEDMQACIHDLDAGTDPVTGGWEDGNGDTCSLDGWGE